MILLRSVMDVRERRLSTVAFSVPKNNEKRDRHAYKLYYSVVHPYSALNGIILSYFSNFPTNLQRFCGFLPRFSCSPMRLCAVFTAGLAFRSSNHTKVSHCSSLHQKSHNTQKRQLHEYKFYKNQLNLSAKHTGTANVYHTNFKQ